MNNTGLVNVLWQSNADAAGYSLSNLGGAVLTAGDITLFRDPTSALHAATKQYVDAVATGLDVKASVRAATTGALAAHTRSGNILTASANGAFPAQDGVTLGLNDSLLVKDEGGGTHLENGIYTLTQVGDGSNPWKLTRRTDADASIEVTSGMFTFITEGTTQKSEGWVLTTADPITLNTTALTFTQFTGAGEITAGNGIVKVANTLHFAQSAAYTVGAISYATSTSAMGFDAANLSWDGTNHWLVLGTERAIQMASVDQPFMFMVAHSTGSGNNNPTLSTGYNFNGLLSVSDARISNTKPGISIDIEARYTPDGVIFQHEWNHNYRSSDGTTYRRAFVYTLNNSSYIGTWQWRASSWGWVNEDASIQYLMMNSTGLIIGGALSAGPNRKLEVVDTSGIQVRLTRDGTHYVELGANVDGDFTVSSTAGRSRFLSGVIRVEASTAPTTGKGIEIGYNAGTDTGTIIAFNRDTVAYKLLNLDGSTISLNSGSGGGVGVGTASPSCKLDVNGVIRAQGSTGASTGAGTEISYGSSVGQIIAFDRTGGVYKQLKLDGLSVAINSGSGGSVGIKLSTITALLHIAGGTTAASTAPLKFTSGSRMTTAEVGACEYNNDFYHTRNGGTVRFGLGGAIFDHFADAGNTTTTETDLYSDTLAASTFDANGVKVFADYGGTFVSSGTATRQIKVYFGGTVILDTGALSISASASWSLYVMLIRASSSEVRYFAALQTSSAALASYASSGAVTGLTLTNTQILKITGTAAGVGAATNDIVAKLGAVGILALA